MHALTCCLVSLLFGFSLNDVPPCNDVYVIEVPQNIALAESGSFSVRISSNNLNEYQTLHVDFPDELILCDLHGKQDINVDLSNNTLIYRKNDVADKQISYSVDNLAVGEYNGSMNMRIYLEDTTPSSVLTNGRNLNEILNSIDPTSISFQTSFPYSENDIDVSLGQDRSLLLNNDDRSVTIYPREGNMIIANPDMSKALGNLTKLETINGINLLEMDECENISSLFKGDIKLTAINGLDSFDTHNVTNMSRMFEMCTSLVRLNLNSLDTSNCSYMSYMFSHCLSLTTPGSLRNWDLAKCQTCSHMFYNCPKLRNLGTMASWDTSNITDMSSMFENCPVLIVTGDISGWNVSNVESFRSMFRLASSMRNIGNLGLWNISENCHDLSYMFAESEEILPDDLDLSDWNICNVSDASGMFRNCFSLGNLNIAGWNSHNLCNIASMFECNSASKQSHLQNVYGIEDLDVSNISDISYAFYGARNFDVSRLKDWDLPSLINKNEAFGGGAGADVPSEIPAWYYD